MLVGPAIGDLEGDGLIDIVLCTWDDNIYAINNVGSKVGISICVYQSI